MIIYYVRGSQYVNYEYYLDKNKAQKRADELNAEIEKKNENRPLNPHDVSETCWVQEINVIE